MPLCFGALAERRWRGRASPYWLSLFGLCCFVFIYILHNGQRAEVASGRQLKDWPGAAEKAVGQATMAGLSASVLRTQSSHIPFIAIPYGQEDSRIWFILKHLLSQNLFGGCHGQDLSSLKCVN